MAQRVNRKIRLVRGTDFFEIEQQDRFLFLREGLEQAVEVERTERFFDPSEASDAFDGLVTAKESEGFLGPRGCWPMGPWLD